MFSDIDLSKYIDYADYTGKDTSKDTGKDIGKGDKKLLINKPVSKYRNNKTGEVIVYDNETMVRYKTLRERKMDPLYDLDLNSDTKAFVFKHQWNPFTGERLGDDPYGPLYFHPDSLIRYFHTNLLNNLWISGTQDESGNYYEGYYGPGLGAGKNFLINGKTYPEKYLFRLPITDCYISTNIDVSSFVTMGPLLFDKEIEEIQIIAETHYKNDYFMMYGTERPSIVAMKKAYDDAIRDKADLTANFALTTEEFMSKFNRDAVDKLKKL